MTRNIAVIGAGGFGTAVAMVLHENGHRVRMWGHDASNIASALATGENSKFLPGVTLPQGLELTANREHAVAEADLVVNAVPTAWLREVFQSFRPLLPAKVPLVSLTKGIEVDTLLRPSQMLKEEAPGHPVAILSGPSHAEEVARRVPSSVVIASEEDALAQDLQDAFGTDRFRVYASPDPVGVELGGALKNVIALAAGVCDGLGFGDNTKAALVTRGLVEIGRLSEALGARKETFAGLAGMGDLITTAFSRHGRNRAVGERIGRGETLEEILATAEKVAEGVGTTKAVRTLAKQHQIEMPISREVHAMLFEGKAAPAALEALMNRSSKVEVW